SATTVESAEEFLVRDGQILCACGEDGFYSGAVSDTPTLQQHNDQLVPPGDGDPTPSYDAVAYYKAAAAPDPTLYLGVHSAVCTTELATHCHTVYVGTGFAPSWSDITYTLGTNRSDVVAGTTVTWWMSGTKDNLI